MKGRSIDYLALGHVRQTRLLARVAKAHLKAGNYGQMLELLTNVALDDQADIRTRTQAALGLIRSADRLATALRSDDTLRGALPQSIVINIGIPEVRQAMPAAKVVDVQVVPAPPTPPTTNGHTNGNGKAAT